MTRRKWLLAGLLAVATAGGAWAYVATTVDTGYICPITGEHLPCPKCCPLNHR
jgi:hypothetical protein